MTGKRKDAIESYLSDIRAKKVAALTPDERIENMYIAMAYDEIRKEIQYLIKMHNIMDNQQIIVNENGISMRFNSPLIKFHAEETESANIVFTDPTLPFILLMIRMIEGDNAKTLGDYAISINADKEGNMYTPLDVVSTFNYIKNGELLNIFKQTGGTGITPNPEVKLAFIAGINEVKGIIKNIFSSYNEEFMILKAATSNHIDGICLHNAVSYSPDSFLELLLCYEIFNLVSLDI